MPLQIVTSSPLPAAEIDFGYAAVIEAAGGSGPFQWTLVGGSLPPGLSLDTTSTSNTISLAGVPTSTGQFSFTVEIRDQLNAVSTKTFTLAVVVKPQLVTFSTRVLDPNTHQGVQVQSITAQVYDVQHQLRDEFVFPVGMVESQDNDGFLYVVHDYDISDPTRFRGKFLHVRWSGIVNGQALTPWWELVPIGEELVPTIDPSRQPYASLPEAHRYFEQLFDKRDRWATFSKRETDQLLALVAASDQIDLEKFKGFRLRIFEEARVIRQFPRFMPLGERARGLLGDSTIPIRVQYACCEQALWLLEQRQQGHDMQMRQFLQNSGLTSMTRGTQQESWNLSSAQNSKLCPDAYQLLQPFLAVGIDDTPGVI
jgi:hypothetical protein